jgi:hypothetical protein
MEVVMVRPANAGDARPSRWKPLADRIFQALKLAKQEQLK